MNQGPFPHREPAHDPLTPEEQALARRLASLHSHAGPSPDVDARILAAARADAHRPSRATRRPRWPVATGLAASLLLAVGIAWQLRPLPGPAVPSAGPPAVRATAPPAAEAHRESAPTESAAMTAPPSPAQPAPVPHARRARPAPAPAPATPEEAEEPDVAFDAPAPMAAALPPPPAPAAPPSTEAGAPAMAARKAASDVPPSEAPSTQAMVAAEAANQAAGDEPATEVPPATAESPEVRDAWLSRIRELAAHGQTDDARASLKEFVRRHPDVPVPDDLRPLTK